ncbi:putative acid phosphatase [Lepidopterella palustris CBS 459.81]|uniref:Putative acid phosphatase n=1 Tax=Lepidopterella palustris CBS 459.81 TaxID=1314670 RepID=A0A8E2E366_9PEZI|nr:putative acid phosphatase [Lepidopterella palustris CBS 459.81]
MLFLFALALFPFGTLAVRIVHSNDDGWAEINIRTLIDTVTAAGYDVILSAPAENKSGSGSLDADPTSLTSACEFDSCPPGSPPTNYNASNPRLNYVNSYPVTSMRYGISTLAPKFFGSETPDLALSGPNVGSNLGFAVWFSGTVGAAVYAVKTAGIPAIAFSGSSGTQTGWTAPTPLYSSIYADLALNLTSTILASGTPYLPAGIFLNVNFPEVSSGSCGDVGEYKFVLSRIFTAILAPDDVSTCGSTRLPTESDVVGTSGCYVSVSVGDASMKTDANATMQAVILGKLKSLLSCLS